MATEKNRAAMKAVSHQRLLVPLDGSEMAECVLPHVIELIRPGETRVYLFSILTTGLGDRTVALMTTYPPGMQLSTTALARAQAHLEVYLRDIAARLREHGAIVRHDIRTGNPAEEILNYALEIEADIIVMSAHGHSGANRWVYGSVASRVLRGAPCPVLLVRPLDS